MVVLNTQMVGNIGLFYACYRLSRLGWNVMPTTRNAKGVDVLIYSQDAAHTQTIQVKALSKRDSVPLGTKLDHLLADYVIICRHVVRETPECFVLTSDEVRRLAQQSGKAGNASFWLEPREYEAEVFHENWQRLGFGLQHSQQQA